MQLLSLFLLEVLGANGQVDIENDIIETVQRELDMSVNVNQKLFNAIDTETEKTLKSSEDQNGMRENSYEFVQFCDYDFRVDEDNAEPQVSVKNIDEIKLLR